MNTHKKFNHSSVAICAPSVAKNPPHPGYNATMLDDGQITRRTGGLIEIRAGGLRVQWELGPVVLAESLLAERPALIVVHVRDYFQATRLPAATQCLGKMDINRVRSEARKAEVIAGLMAAGQKLAFG